VPLRLIVLLAPLTLLVCAAEGAAQSAPTNDVCLTCHGEPDMRRANGTSVTVDPKAFEHSVHSPLSCTDCHADLAKTEDFPHPEKLAKVDCSSCHDDPAKQLLTSVHARRPHGNGPALACIDCHGPPHQILPSSDPQSATNKLTIATTCGRCHGDSQAPQGFRGPAVARSFSDSIHGEALIKAGLVVAPTCSDCHTSHRVVEKTSPESPVFGTNVPATCGKCHAGVEREYHQGVHGVALAAGDKQAPQCATCHTAHGITRTEGADWQLAAVKECGTCHAQALATYRDTYHGKVTQLGFSPVAKCADCHRPHQIFKPGDPRSSVHPQNLQATCGKCHGQVSANFVQYQPHANPHSREKLPALYYSARFMNGLLIGVFAFFGLHTTLWFVRERFGPRDDTKPGSGASNG